MLYTSNVALLGLLQLPKSIIFINFNPQYNVTFICMLSANLVAILGES